MNKVQVSDHGSLYYVTVLDDDELSASPSTIRCRGPNGVMYARYRLGTWSAIEEWALRNLVQAGVA